MRGTARLIDASGAILVSGGTMSVRSLATALVFVAVGLMATTIVVNGLTATGFLPPALQASVASVLGALSGTAAAAVLFRGQR